MTGVIPDKNFFETSNDSSEVWLLSLALLRVFCQMVGTKGNGPPCVVNQDK